MKFGEWLDHLFRDEPDGPAVQYEGSWWTWSDLEKIRDRLDGALTSGEVGQGRAVAIILRERPQSFCAFAALLGTGRCAVLITPIQPDAALCQDVRELRPVAIVAETQDWARHGLMRVAGEVGSLSLELRGDGGPLVTTVPGLEHPSDGHHLQLPAEVRVTLLTSGTTGKPKRVPVTTDTLDRPAPSQLRPVGQRGVSINAIPLVSIGGATGVINSIWRGRPTALMDRFDVMKWAELVREHRPRRLSAPPATLRMLLDRQVPAEYLSSGQVFIAGSAPLDLETSDQFEATYGIPVVRTYGATEFLGPLTAFAPDEYPLAKAKRGSVGRALPGTKIRIVDPDTGEQCLPGAAGVLEANPARRAIDQPAGWIRTNDLAHMDEDGFVWIDGRADDVLIRGGFKVPLADVADCLRAHPAIAEAYVVALSDATLNQVPGAVITMRPDSSSLTEEELKRWVRDRKPPYYVPVRILVTDELPRNAMLKVIPARVRALLEAARPAAATSVSKEL